MTGKTTSAPAADPQPAKAISWVGSRFSNISPTRSLLMMTFGAVLGLAIAGFGLFTAKGSTSNQVPPEDVALVNNRPVLVSDFVAQVEAENGTPFSEAPMAMRKRVLNSMIREELYVQRGLELDFPASDPDTRTALVAAVEQQVAADVTAQQPTEAQLMAYYEKNKLKYSSDGTITLNELVLPGPVTPESTAKAAQAVQALRSKTPVETVMTQYGLKDSGRVDDGEEFYFATKIHLGDKLFAAAAALPTGSTTDPVAAADGLHIIQVITNKQPVALSFPDAREKVFFDFKKEAEGKLQDADERYLRAKADVQIAKEYR